MLYSIVLVANKEMSVTDILKTSLKASKEHRWSILLIILIVSIPNLFLMSLPYLLASLIDGFISAYVFVSLALIYLESSEKNI